MFYKRPSMLQCVTLGKWGGGDTNECTCHHVAAGNARPEIQEPSAPSFLLNPVEEGRNMAGDLSESAT